jgi:hypothetical protein
MLLTYPYAMFDYARVSKMIRGSPGWMDALNISPILVFTLTGRKWELDIRYLRHAPSCEVSYCRYIGLKLLTR